MAKIFAALLAGMSLSFALPGLAVEKMGKTKDEGEYVKKAIHVEIKGKLGHLFAHRAPVRLDPWYSGGIAANGKTYPLFFYAYESELVKKARQLEGKTVVVTGVVQPESERIVVTDLRADAGATGRGHPFAGHSESPHARDLLKGG
jgi:hypothetical protein